MNTFTKAIAVAMGLCLCAGQLHAFGFDDVLEKAAELAKDEFQYPDSIPKSLSALSYDQHRDIRFKQDKTLWQSSRKHFDAQLMHNGGIFNYGVKIHIHDAEGVHEYSYSAEDFDFGQNAIPKDLPEELGFAGFKLRYPINKPNVQDEVIVFAGASYFRAVSKDTLYGLSARGLAIDTALPSGEEFPIFREFWLQRPAAGSEHVRLFALLDSKSVTGAYEFVVYPGETTRTRVKATLIARKEIQELGIAPLTSMFFLGENTLRPAFEWRPEIHDSDGLMLVNGNGERIWRPLENQKQLRLSMLALESPEGFGLIQRDRDFRSYEDLETNQEKRPSAWVSPIGDWGKGAVKLIEIPTNNEYNDNIVTYWVPEQKLETGKPATFEYWLDWNKLGPELESTGEVVSTRLAIDEEHNKRQFVIDIQGQELLELSREVDIEANIWTDTHIRLSNYHITPNPQIGGIRLTINLEKEKTDERSEIRVRLWHEGKPRSEIWTYLLEK